MVQIAYNRLAEALKQLPEEDEPNTHRHLMTCAVHDAWSIIDSADRLRGLVSRSTLLNQIEKAKQKFISNADPIRKLRNTLQHIDTLIPNHAGAEWPVWGFLRWFCWKEFPHTGISCQLLAGGHVTKRPFNIGGPHPECSGENLSDVFLSNKGIEVSLRDIKNCVEALSIEVESLIEKLAAERGLSQTRFADVFISAHVDFRKK
ncbi:hypothetical protein D3878_02460 [Noviherbaspirillum sedimenti]|uniref:Uncharacterized protein n=2 Tax=Noviherbaspirillum sedimenti TaxID=2320865 RepID=A0A3A3FWQ2_9BURK|nr:hypothetical protein D3878_02460 [Noviherbaspirillum sedimenti]